MYPFGSIYYTDRNSTFTKGWPRERMTKSERACGILENAIRSDMVWFKTSMYEKVRLYCVVCSNGVKQRTKCVEQRIECIGQRIECIGQRVKCEKYKG